MKAKPSSVKREAEYQVCYAVQTNGSTIRYMNRAVRICRANATQILEDAASSLGRNTSRTVRKMKTATSRHSFGR